ncbi:hypothetical protein [Vibrio sp. ED004]|uniref:hypothetical protein n=1 Tax=Vibrio sp. ED004 TaxID=2785124 RepID=UPI0020BE6039|nr:hypothetical protein [Vibrio sp. ED004]
MKSILLTSALMVLVGCSDQVTNEYSTYAEAKSDNLFDRAWLPDILPESTTSIEVTNDLDNNSFEWPIRSRECRDRWFSYYGRTNAE